jgi:hypothetical protein
VNGYFALQMQFFTGMRPDKVVVDKKIEEKKQKYHKCSDNGFLSSGFNKKIEEQKTQIS